MKISVITINYNNKEGLEKTMASVTSQKGFEPEYLVIDGGSTDGSVEAIRRLENKISYWVSEKDKGIYHAQNKGIVQAKGDYCLFLNSGDVLASENTLKTVAAELGKEDIVYGDLITLGQKAEKKTLQSPDRPDVQHFMVSTLWHPVAFIRRSLFQSAGLLREDLKITGDYEFFIRSILVRKASTRHIPVPVTVFNLDGVSNNESMAQLQTAERRKSWELNFSTSEIEAMEKHTRFVRSRLYQVLNAFNPFSKKR